MTTMDQHPQPSASCLAVTVYGRACNAKPLKGRQVCWHHAPELAEERAEASRRGGRNKATAARVYAGLPAPIAELLSDLRGVFAETRAGTMAPARAQACASVGRALLATWDLGVTEARLDDLERDVRILEGAPLRSVR
jgi:hypothetical protein